MRKLTRKDLKGFKKLAREFGHGWFEGYCCYQDHGYTDEIQLECIGYNSGKYGWNWSLYTDGLNYYVSGYRNY